MTKYKLLKKLPGLEVGTIIGYVGPRTQYSNDNVRINRGMKEGIDIDWNNLNSFQKYSYKLLENIIENNHYDGWLEEIEEEKTIYNLDVGDGYYYINDLGIIKLISIDSIDSIKNYKQRLEIGNVFLTYQEVLKELYKRKSLAKIRKWIRENKIELSKDFDGYTIYGEVNKIVVGRFMNCRNEFGIIFQNEKDAEKCLKECKKEWKILYLK